MTVRLVSCNLDAQMVDCCDHFKGVTRRLYLFWKVEWEKKLKESTID